MRHQLLLVFLSAAITLPLLADDDGNACKQINQPCATNSQDKQARRRATIQELYTDLIFPKPVQIISVPPVVSVDDIFESSVVRGRVTPVGQFSGFESVREYFFGLAVTPNSRVESVNIRKLISSGSDVAVDVDIFFCQQTTPCSAPTPKTPGVGFTLTQTGFFTFNGNDKVTAFDLSILNLGAEADPQSDAERQTNIQQVCAFLTLQSGPSTPGTCPTYFDNAAAYVGSGYTFNPNLPLPAFSNCVGFMNSIPYGSWNRANSNTVVCRQLHSLLTPLRPQVHCPHTSPTGGLT